MTFVLWAAFPVKRDTRDGQHNATVQKGGYPMFIEEGFNDNYLPVWLQEAGYNTYYTGKLMNGHSITTYDAPRASGWNGSDCKLFEMARVSSHY